ncbi:MAG: trypsin-like serine protease [Bdellovibrionales bacterium]|nr:trypsin-like serine protease [Bdellovibrionales bacterium]
MAILIGFALACGGGSGSGSDETPTTLAATSNACNLVGLKVANGQTCEPGEDPSASSLVKLEIFNTDGTAGLCTGTVIDSTTILTAAHCLFNPAFITIETFGGTFSAVSYSVQSGFGAEPSPFDPSVPLFFNDAALVFTDVPLPVRITPILFSRAPEVGEEVLIGGFGEVSPGGSSGAAVAGAATVTAVTPNHITISFSDGQAHPCQGDSGGPILFRVGNSLAVGGVVSQSDPSVDPGTVCRPGDITLYTNLQSAATAQFLAEGAPDAPLL